MIRIARLQAGDFEGSIIRLIDDILFAGLCQAKSRGRQVAAGGCVGEVHLLGTYNRLADITSDPLPLHSLRVGALKGLVVEVEMIAPREGAPDETDIVASGGYMIHIDDAWFTGVVGRRVLPAVSA